MREGNKQYLKTWIGRSTNFNELKYLPIGLRSDRWNWVNSLSIGMRSAIFKQAIRTVYRTRLQTGDHDVVEYYNLKFLILLIFKY